MVFLSGYVIVMEADAQTIRTDCGEDCGEDGIEWKSLHRFSAHVEFLRS